MSKDNEFHEFVVGYPHPLAWLRLCPISRSTLSAALSDDRIEVERHLTATPAITIPYPLNHVAVSVPDIEAAVKWYTEILGFHQLRSLTTLNRAEVPDATMFKIYPADLNKVSIVPLSAGNGIGVELFQFHDPKITEETRAKFANDYKRGGFFHIGVTAPDIEALAEKAVAAGAKRIGPTVPVYQYDAMYIEDPWGNVVELISASFERVMSNRG